MRPCAPLTAPPDYLKGKGARPHGGQMTTTTMTTMTISSKSGPPPGPPPQHRVIGLAQDGGSRTEANRARVAAEEYHAPRVPQDEYDDDDDDELDEKDTFSDEYGYDEPDREASCDGYERHHHGQDGPPRRLPEE